MALHHMEKKNEDEGEQNLQQLFWACDLDGSGYIDQSELATVCTDMSTDELNNVFEELDTDGDGRISVDEFAHGFKEISSSLLQKSRERRRKSLADLMDEEDIFKESSCNEFVGTLEEGFKCLSCQDKVCDLYEILHRTGNTDAVGKLEAVIINVINDIRTYKRDAERLEKLFQKLVKFLIILFSIKYIGKQLEIKISLVSHAVVWSQEQQKHELDKIELRKSLENEIYQLRETIRHLEINELFSSSFREKREMMDFMKEQDNLTRQLHLLHDANKKLHDTNDDLREALDMNRQQTAHKRSYSSGAPIITSNLNKPFTDGLLDSPLVGQPAHVAASLAEEVVMAEALVQRKNSPNMLRIIRKGSYEEDSIAEDVDSGHSTIRDAGDMDTESEYTSTGDDFLKGRRHKRFRPVFEEQDSHDEIETETEVPTDDQDADLFKATAHRCPASVGSRGSNRSLRDSGNDLNSNQLPNRISRRGPSIQQELANQKAMKEPERMYKVVLAGDAAVGKTSFIMRLCKGKFVTNLSSTLGVDFQTKTLCVDGHTIALQLWDTAGQERFRSIAKSYFRRADGVLLLYDCTYERSFINVRDWLQTIENGAQKRLPIMLCANKTDLRAEMEAHDRRTVKFEDGQRLARTFEGLFIETSAKDGNNINEAVLELTRLLRTNEDLEVRSVGMRLFEMRNEPTKKPGICCKT
ncbi:ras and EF-hand domain-containing protein homolog [Octopus bimaculoides]|nr:ras and EF-hand domain-containing protein homolog [Octopus bimaculoides]